MPDETETGERFDRPVNITDKEAAANPRPVLSPSKRYREERVKNQLKFLYVFGLKLSI